MKLSKIKKKTIIKLKIGNLKHNEVFVYFIHQNALKLAVLCSLDVLINFVWLIVLFQVCYSVPQKRHGIVFTKSKINLIKLYSL